MSDNTKNSLPRRDAILAMIASAGAMGASGLVHAQAPSATPQKNSMDGNFKPTIPFQVPANTKVPFQIALYGDCNGLVDIVMSDFKPALNKMGEYIDKNGNVVDDPKLAKLSPQKNVLLYGRDLPGPENYGQTPKVAQLPDGSEVKIGADFGGHYHEDAEVIYCPNGRMLIEVRENSGQRVPDFEGDLVEEKLPEAQHGERKLQYVNKAGEKTEFIDLTDEIQSVVIERGGMVTIPARCYHSVIMLETGDMLAYLPDGKRWAEQSYSNPGQGAQCN